MNGCLTIDSLIMKNTALTMFNYKTMICVYIDILQVYKQ